MTFPLPESVMVANRGEIAARVFRTAREFGVRSVAVYCDAESTAGWTLLADEAYRVEGSTAAETYLDVPSMVEAIRRSGAAAVHPGYGFLSENAEFARAVSEAGATWVGPSPEAIEALGDKARARALAISSGVGVIPGTETPIRSFHEILEFGERVGFPVVAKDPAGGGGRGIIEFTDPEQLRRYFEERQLPTEGDLPEPSPFGASFLEKRLVGARHIETQCVRDSHGEFWLASTRDCSIQRRNQKLIEEAPAPALSEKTQQNLRDWSQALCEAVNYVGAGTCEFLVDADGNAYFLEVNPRLQVEHTVTEEVTGVDLVAVQLSVAQGAHLSQILPEDRSVRGCSIQLRITSEDPAQGLIPTGGTIRQLAWPSGAGIRIDAALNEGESIPTAFDSLIAKVIVTASTREQAIARAQRALSELSIEGVANSAPLYEVILADPAFQAGDGSVHTRWLEATHLSPEGLAALAAQGAPAASNDASPASTISLDDAIEMPIEIDGRRHILRLPSRFGAAFGGAPTQVAATRPSTPTVPPPATGMQVRRQRRDSQAMLGAQSGSVTAPMQATVNRVLAEVGQEVGAGDLVCVIEAMKMEQPLYAPVAGVVSTVHVAAGDAVSSGQVLISIEERSDAE